MDMQFHSSAEGGIALATAGGGGATLQIPPRPDSIRHRALMNEGRSRHVVKSDSQIARHCALFRPVTSSPRSAWISGMS